jgi:hypothetical protein
MNRLWTLLLMAAAVLVAAAPSALANPTGHRGSGHHHKGGRHHHKPTRHSRQTRRKQRAPITPPRLQFSAARHYLAAGGWLLTAGDVLGNGRWALASANILSLGTNAGTLLINTTRAPTSGPPTFAAPVQFDGYGAQAPLLADFTGTGKPDLVLCDLPLIPNGRCRVYPNETPAGASTPTWGAPLTLSAGDTPEVLGAGDFTGDGKLDLEVTNFGSLGPGEVYIFRNTSTNGHTSFAPPQIFTGEPPGLLTGPPATKYSPTIGVGAGPEGSVIADLNSDGKPDIVLGNTAGNNLTGLINETPTGSTQLKFSAPQLLPGNTLGPTSVTAADLNADGKLDIVAGTSFTLGPQDIDVYMNQTPTGSDTLRFAPVQVFAGDPGVEGITAADFSGTGKPDIAYASYRSAAACGGGGIGVLAIGCSLGGALDDNGTQGVVGIFHNLTPTRSMIAKFAAPLKLGSGLGTVTVISGDFNGDCKPDIAAGNFLGGTNAGISIFTNQTRWTHKPDCPAKPVAGIGPGLGL